jgi:hypothetical protein
MFAKLREFIGTKWKYENGFVYLGYQTFFFNCPKYRQKLFNEAGKGTSLCSLSWPNDY